MTMTLDDERIKAVAQSICTACRENPMSKGHVQGHDFRWQDYRESAISAIQATNTTPDMPRRDRVVAGYTADSMSPEKRAFTVYRDHQDAVDEARAMRSTVTPLYKDTIMTTQRSPEDVQKAIDNIRDEIESLPAESAFGDSNAEAMDELQEWLVALQKAQGGQPSGNEVVDIWLGGEWSEISDYCS